MTRMSSARRLAALLAVAGVVALTGCSPATAPAGPPAKVDATDVPAPAPVEQTSEPELNAHGYTAMSYDDAAVIYYPGTEDIAVSMTITSVTRNVECTDEWALPSELGEIVALNMTITTDADYQKLTANEPMRLFWNNFYFWSDGDDTQKDIFPGFGCLPEANEMPRDIPAGQTTTYPYFIDVSQDAASVAWEPSSFVLPDLGGWEWPLK